MKALFVSAHFPTNLKQSTTGTYKRMRTFVDALRERTSLRILFYFNEELTGNIPETAARLKTEWQLHDVDIVLCPLNDEPEHLDRLWDGYFARALSIHRQLGYACTSGHAQVEAFEQCLADSPDIVFAHRLQAMCPMLLTRQPLPPVFMDLDDVEHKAFVRRISQPPKWFGKKLFHLQRPALVWGERKALKSTRKAFVCSDLDKQYLAQKWDLQNVAVIPNSIHIPDIQDVTDEPVLLFLGAYGYRPNAMAAAELVSQIWPWVRQRSPNARLIIAGANPEFIPTFSKPEPGVEYSGFADDLDALYRRTRVVCCPIRAGGGTRIKIIEAAAYGKPVVSTHIGAEGLDFIDGQEILLRDDVHAFADACVHLFTDKNASIEIGGAARAKAEKLYERRSVIGQIQKEILGS